MSGNNIEDWKCTATTENSAFVPEMATDKQSDKL